MMVGKRKPGLARLRLEADKGGAKRRGPSSTAVKEGGTRGAYGR